MTPWKAALAPWDTAAEQMMALKQGYRKKHIRKRYIMTLGAVLQRFYLLNKTCLRHSYPTQWPMVPLWHCHSFTLHSGFKEVQKAQLLLSVASTVKKASKRWLAQPWFCSVMCHRPLDAFVLNAPSSSLHAVPPACFSLKDTLSLLSPHPGSLLLQHTLYLSAMPWCYKGKKYEIQRIIKKSIGQ